MIAAPDDPSAEQLRALGAAIMGTRRQAGFRSQEALGKRVGVSGSTIKRLEGGDGGVGLAVIFAIADACGVTPGELWRRAGLL